MTFTNTTISLICSTYKKWELLSFSIRVQVQSQRLKFEQILILCLFRRFVYILYTYGPVVPHQGPKIQKSLSKPKKWKSRVSMSRFHDYICWREKKPSANFQVWVIHKFWEIMEIYLIFWFLFLYRSRTSYRLTTRYLTYEPLKGCSSKSSVVRKWDSIENYSETNVLFQVPKHFDKHSDKNFLTLTSKTFEHPHTISGYPMSWKLVPSASKSEWCQEFIG